MNRDEQQRELAAMFKALGDPTRLRIFEYLRACSLAISANTANTADAARPDSGITVGEVSLHLTGDEHVSSTISFHMKELRTARLIQMERRGKNILCRVEPAVLDQLAGYFGNDASSLQRGDAIGTR